MKFSIESESNLATYEEAMANVDSAHWVKAMNVEMESIDSNQVWDLVEEPANIKPIGCKRVYKRKKGSDGKVENFKARPVAKGYTQRKGIDCKETFLLVAVLKSIRILLSIIVCLDCEILQMDIQTAFLNGKPEENIYMQQPEWFVAGRKGNLVCKLHKSIY